MRRENQNKGSTPARSAARYQVVMPFGHVISASFGRYIAWYAESTVQGKAK
jgi:hypothetical protein